MAKYSDIKGFTVQTLSTDTIASAIDGGSWASGGDLNTARRGMGGAGTANTALLASGGDSPSPSGGPFSVLNEQYNGTSWTEVGDLTLGRKFVGDGGTQTAAIIYGGRKETPATESNDTEIWNGSGWTEVNNLNEAKQLVGSAGTSTANLCFGGADTGTLATTESWDGTNWTEVNDLNTGRYNLAGTGTQTAALATPGGNPIVTATESWDGTSWTEIADLNTPRQGPGASGSYTDSLVYGGESPITAKTEFWNGSTWTEVADLSIARETGGTGRQLSTSEAVFFGGDGPGAGPRAVATEEWSAPAVFNQITEGQLFFNSTTNTFKETIFDVPGATWASGGDLNTARTRFGGAGQAPQSAALVFGAGSSPYGQTEEYNGTSWSEQNDLNSGRYISPGGAGTQTAALTAGGYYPAGSPNATALSESYNGTSWTEGNDLNEGRFDCVTFGSSTSAILVGGGESPGGPGTVTSVEIYDGTSWTETTDIPTATQEMAGWGTQTSGAIVGGSVDSDPTMKNTTVEWDGTSWSSGGNYSRNNKYFQAFGANVSSGLAAGGENPGESPARLSIAAIYDGTSWSEVAELSSARYGTAGGGTALSGLISGGETAPTTVASTEEWTVNLGNKTITSS